MKHTIITLALILALAMSCVAMAEEMPGNLPAEGTDIVEEMPNDTAPEAPDAPDAPDAAPTSNEPVDAVPTDDLKAAMDAYRAAKQDKAVDDLEEELDSFVEDGSLTQEQADLILNSVKERIAAKNGECPNCGYKFDKGNRQFSGQQFPGQKQMPGQQNHFPGQMGGKQGGCQQNQCPGMQGNQDKNQCPGMQGNQDKKQFSDKQQMPGDQRPDAQSGATPRDNSKNQMPGQKQFSGKQQMPGGQRPDAQSGATPRDNSRNQMPGQKQFPGQQNGNQMMPGNQQFPGKQNGVQRGNRQQMPGGQQQIPGMAPQM